MKNEALKKLIREEIKNLIKEEEGAPVDTGSALAKNIRITGNDLAKNPSGIMPKEAEGLKILLDRLISIAKKGTLNDNTLNRINDILDIIDK